MASRQAHRLFAVLSLAVTLALGGPAFAQDEEPSEETARKVLQIVKNANDEFDRGEFSDALELYQEAYDLFPDAVLLYRIGLAAEKSGELRRAVDSYKAYLDASGEDDAAAKRVAEKLPDLQAKLAPLVVVNSTPEGADVFLNDMDGESLGQTPTEFELESGEATIVVRLEGYRVVREDLELENGDREELSVELKPLEKLASIDPGDEAPAETDDGSIGTWGWVATGTGAALLATGAVFTGLSVSTTADVNDYDKRAPDASREELDDLKLRATSFYETSVATYIVGGVFTAIGVALLVVDGTSDSGASTDDAEASVRLELRPTTSGGWVGLTGRF